MFYLYPLSCWVVSLYMSPVGVAVSILLALSERGVVYECILGGGIYEYT